MDHDTPTATAIVQRERGDIRSALGMGDRVARDERLRLLRKIGRRCFPVRNLETTEVAIASIILEPVRIPEKTPAAKIMLDTMKILLP